MTFLRVVKTSAVTYIFKDKFLRSINVILKSYSYFDSMFCFFVLQKTLNTNILEAEMCYCIIDIKR